MINLIPILTRNRPPMSVLMVSIASTFLACLIIALIMAPVVFKKKQKMGIQPKFFGDLTAQEVERSAKQFTDSQKEF